MLILGTSALFGRASCLSNPCEPGLWCVQGTSSTEHVCVRPTNSDCSFEEGQCDLNTFYADIASSNNEGVINESLPFHDHTFGVCRGKYILGNPIFHCRV